MSSILRHSAVFTLGFALAFHVAPLYAQQPQQLNPILKNWAAPLYWAPTPAESQQLRLEHGASSLTAAQAASIFTAPGPMTFIAMTPCRVMDTRGEPYSSLTGVFGPPALSSGTARGVPLPVSSNCTIPTTAAAYSLNITAISDAGGTLSSLSVWPVGTAYPGVSNLNDPVPGGVIANAVIAVAGTLGGIELLAVTAGGTATDVIIDINGYYAAPTDSNQNTGLGTGALASNSGGSADTAVGYQAAEGGGDSFTAIGYQAAESSGEFSTSIGDQASGGTGSTGIGYGAGSGMGGTGFGFGAALGSGSFNTGIGSSAGGSNGSFNTASGVQVHFGTGGSNVGGGYQTMYNNTNGHNDTAIGNQALVANTTGSGNVAFGKGALGSNTTGGLNIAIGEGAASSVSHGNGNNIHIGSQGVSSDNGVIRIGNTQTSAYVAGIYGGMPSVTNSPVCVDANGTLGTVGCRTTSSSRRFKEQITDVGDSSGGLLQLRPVTFFYKPEFDDGSRTMQYGLIAEEVAEVYPDMVGYDENGQPASVKYQSLAPMLLKEVQKQRAQVQSQAAAFQLEQERNRRLKDRLAALETLLSGSAAAAGSAGSQPEGEGK